MVLQLPYAFKQADICPTAAKTNFTSDEIYISQSGIFDLMFVEIATGLNISIRAWHLAYFSLSLSFIVNRAGLMDSKGS